MSPVKAVSCFLILRFNSTAAFTCVASYPSVLNLALRSFSAFLLVGGFIQPSFIIASFNKRRRVLGADLSIIKLPLLSLFANWSAPGTLAIALSTALPLFLLKFSMLRLKSIVRFCNDAASARTLLPANNWSTLPMSILVPYFNANSGDAIRSLNLFISAWGAKRQTFWIIKWKLASEISNYTRGFY